MATKSSMQFPKDSNERIHLEKQVMSFLQLKSDGKLTTACSETGFNYQMIYGQLNGYRICKISDVDSFVKAIDKNYQVEMINGNPFVTKINDHVKSK
jgi:hypothetical protein